MTSPHKDLLPTVFGLVRTIRKRFDERAAALDMTYSRAQALTHIAAEEGKSQVELAELLDIRTPTMNRTLDHLEIAGLIERRAASSDKRLRCLFLTPVAHEKAERIVTFTAELQSEIYHGISDDDLRHALETLERIRQNLDGMRS